MAITVQQLVETPHLRTRFYAGQAGGDQVINWAHSCELKDPWDWLEPFDLLMTNGLALPTRAADQATYVDRLADAGLSGVAIGDGMRAPEISTAMARAAERRALPILVTAYEIPFAALARVVAESKTNNEERMRLVRTARIYDCVRMAAIEGGTPGELMASLGERLDCRLDVLDLRTWHYAFAPGARPSESTRRVLEEVIARGAGRLPGILRLDMDGNGALVVPIPSRCPAALLASRFTVAAPGLSLLQHAATVAALELEKLTSEREQQFRAGAELLGALLEGRVDLAEAAVALDCAGLAGELQVAAWNCRPEPGAVRAAAHPGSPESTVHHGLFARDLPHLLRREGHAMLALLPAGQTSLDGLLEAIPDREPVGVRCDVTSLARLPDAAREARWALLTLRPENGRVARYVEDGDSSFPFEFSSAREVAEHVLGPLLRYDRDHRSNLVTTLATVLRHNWATTGAAAELFIHRQTLVYRIRRIEELTGRHLRSTEDIVELWLALRALEVVEGGELLGPVRRMSITG